METSMSISNKCCKFEKIEQLVFEQQPFEVCQIFQIYITLSEYQKILW